MVGPGTMYTVTVSTTQPRVGAPVLVAAQLTDANRNASRTPGRVVTWSDGGAGGSFSSQTSTTQSDGTASVTFVPSVAGITYAISALDGAGAGGASPELTTTTATPPVVLASTATGNSPLASCSIAADGTAWCWGANDSGMLGNGTSVDQSVPGPVSGNLRMTSLSAGADHACGVTTGGVVECWGTNANGELGDNTLTAHPVPAPIASALTFTSVAVGDLHTCAVATGGDAYCWGYNDGRLGSGTPATNTHVPVKVAGGLSFSSITAGGSHTCGITTSGDAYCWGFNSSGQLGEPDGRQPLRSDRRQRRTQVHCSQCQR